MTVLLWAFATNAALTLIFVIVRVAKRQPFSIALFFFFLPILGFAFYYLPIFFQKYRDQSNIDKDGLIVTAFEIEALPEHPDVKEELNVAPVEDALAVAEVSEKRNLLLKQLKRDLTESYKILSAAKGDEDSESAHYAAAAEMEVYRIHQQFWLESRRDLEREPENIHFFHIACDALSSVLKSGVFSEREQNVYRKHLCSLIEKQMATNISELTAEEYSYYLNALIEQGKIEEAEAVWKDPLTKKSEESYKEMLALYYKTGQRDKFEGALKALAKSGDIRLSSTGLEQLRYWFHRLAS